LKRAKTVGGGGTPGAWRDVRLGRTDATIRNTNGRTAGAAAASGRTPPSRENKTPKFPRPILLSPGRGTPIWLALDKTGEGRKGTTLGLRLVRGGVPALGNKNWGTKRSGHRGGARLGKKFYRDKGIGFEFKKSRNAARP